MPDDNLTLVNMAGQFRGLPMKDLIGGPLQAACDAQTLLSAATANFIQDVGFEKGKDKDSGLTARTVDFSFQRPSLPDPTTGKSELETVELEVPLLAIVNTPNLSVKEAEIEFTMNVSSSNTEQNSTDKSGSFDATGGAHILMFSVQVHIHGSIAAHSSTTRKTDNSAKYDVKVIARDDGPPEGLMKVLDMLQTAIAPVPVSGGEKKPN
jgi:hypothetical protein